MIFFLMLRVEWTSGQNDPVAIPGEGGFVHCCDERQIVDVRRRYFPADIELWRSLSIQRGSRTALGPLGALTDTAGRSAASANRMRDPSSRSCTPLTTANSGRPSVHSSHGHRPEGRRARRVSGYTRAASPGNPVPARTRRATESQAGSEPIRAHSRHRHRSRDARPSPRRVSRRQSRFEEPASVC